MKKQASKEKKEGSPTKNAKWNTGKSTTETEFKAMVIRKLKELIDNYQKLQGNHEELTTNYISMKNYQEEPRGNEEYNFWIEEHSRRNQK